MESLLHKGVISEEFADHLAYNALFRYLGRTYNYVGQELSERNLYQLSGVNASLLAFNELKAFGVETSPNTEAVS